MSEPLTVMAIDTQQMTFDNLAYSESSVSDLFVIVSRRVTDTERALMQAAHRGPAGGEGSVRAHPSTENGPAILRISCPSVHVNADFAARTDEWLHQIVTRAETIDQENAQTLASIAQAVESINEARRA